MAKEPPSHPSLGQSQRDLFDRYHGRIRRFFLSRGFNDDEAEDLTQDTLWRVFQHMDKLRAQGSVDAWVLRLAANIWKNELRYRQAAKRSGIDLSLEASLTDGPDALEAAAVRNTLRPPSPLEQALAAEELDAANACFDQLPPGMRRCLALHVHQERKYQEIADLLDLSIQSVKSHIHEARRRLKECVDHKLAGGET